MKKIVSIALLLISTTVTAVDFTQDSGKVTNIFVTPEGAIAFKLNGGRAGIPNAVEKHSCTTGGGWIGHNSADPVIKSAIFTAKAANSDITITVSECEGGWFKIKDLYIN